MIEHCDHLQIQWNANRNVLDVVINLAPHTQIETLSLRFMITENGGIIFGDPGDPEKEKATLSDGLTFSPELDLKSS